MTLKEFLELPSPDKYDFTDIMPCSEYTNMTGIDKYFTYKLSVVKQSDWYYNGAIPNEAAHKKWREMREKGVFEGVGDDPDINSELLREIYSMLWDRALLQSHSDAMNSVQTILNGYIGKCLSKKVRLKGIANLYYKEELNVDLSDAERLMNVYHTAGNYLPVPKGVNMWKNATFNDCFDLFLAYIYNYYTEKSILEGNDYEYIPLKGTLVESIKGWLDKFGSWDSFVDKNYLSPFVENGKPKELWKGHFGGTVLPETSEQCNEYFRNSSDCIIKRGELMIEKLRERIKERI